MSSHYFVSFNTELSATLSANEVTALEYTFGIQKKPPNRAPNHWFFENEGTSVLEPWHQSYQDQNISGPNVFRLWRTFDAATGHLIACGVNIHLDGLKLESLWDYDGTLGLLGWLASLSLNHGLVGAMGIGDSLDSIEAHRRELLVVRDGELFVSLGEIGEYASISPQTKQRQE